MEQTVPFLIAESVPDSELSDLINHMSALRSCRNWEIASAQWYAIEIAYEALVNEEWKRRRRVS